MAIVWLMIYFNIGDNLGWMIILIIVILALNCFMYWGLPRIQYKALVKLQGIENEFVFYEDESSKLNSGGGWMTREESSFFESEKLAFKEIKNQVVDFDEIEI